VEESVFPLDCMLNDPTAQAIVADLGLTSPELDNLLAAVRSAKIKAVKPGDQG